MTAFHLNLDAAFSKHSSFYFFPDSVPVESGKRCGSFAAIVVKWKK
jgi:hypothetical protein